MDLVWVVVVAVLALVVGAGGGALLTAVLIAAGRGQGEDGAPCPCCSPAAGPTCPSTPSHRHDRPGGHTRAEAAPLR